MPLVVNGVQVDINAMNNASPVIKQVASDVQGLETSARDAGDGIGSMNTNSRDFLASSRDIGVSLASWGMILDTVADTAVQVYEFAKSGAELELVETRFDRLSASIDTTSEVLKKDLKEATRGLYSDAELMKSATDLMALGLAKDHDEAVRLAAVSAGLNMNMNQLVLTLTNMTTMRFDALGVSVDGFDAKVAKLKATGMSTDAAFKEAFLQQAEDQLERVGHAADSSAGSFMRFETQMANTKDQARAMSNDALEPLIRKMADSTDEYNKNLEILQELDGELGLFENSLARNYAAHRALTPEMEALIAQYERGVAWTEYYKNSMNETITATEQLAGVTQTLVEVDEDAVKGAIKVQEEYDKQSNKLADLQLDHQELLAKKQELIDQGWGPESEKIQNVNDKLADNEQKQKDVTVAMQGTLEQMLLNTAAAGMDAEAQLSLARATGQIDEATYATLSVQQSLKKQYEDNKLSADEYAQKTLALRDAVARLESKHITITAEALFTEIRHTIHTFTEQSAKSLVGGNQKYAAGTDGWMTVPAGYPNDSYPILLTSGERFAVIPDGTQASPMPAGGGMGGGAPIVFAPTIQNMFGNENDMMDSLYGAFTKMLEKAKADGHLNG